jgi:cobalt-zinc-cadmium efflux system outer membrane protein
MRTAFTIAAALGLAAGVSAFSQGMHPANGMATPLAVLIAEAEKNNAQIAGADHAWRASTHVTQQMTTLPDPQVTAQSFSVGSPKPGAGFSNSDFAYVGVGASQDLPYPGKLRLKGEAARREADTQAAQIDVVRTSVVNQIKEIYFRLAYFQQSIDLLDRNENALEALIQNEISNYSLGQGSQADVLRAQLERTKLLREMTMHHEDMGQLQANLKTLLHRPQDAADVIPEKLTATPATFAPSELQDLARGGNAMLQVDQKMVAAQGAQLDSVKREMKPDFNVGYMFQATGSDFRNYYVATFNVRFPRRKRVDAEIAESSEKLERSRADADADLQQQMAEVQKEYVTVRSSAELMKQYKEGLIPQARALLQSELSAYQSGREKFSAVLGAFMDQLTFEHDYQQALLDHETALAHLETLTGATLR